MKHVFCIASIPGLLAFCPWRDYEVDIPNERMVCKEHFIQAAHDNLEDWGDPFAGI